MPGWAFHRKNMKLTGEDAELLLKLMDSGNSEVHMKWRKTTHKPKNAAKVALLVSLCSDNPSQELFLNALDDVMKHIADDEMLNKLIYGKKQEDSSVNLKQLLALIRD